MAKKLIELFPEHTCYVEVFGGALNVLFTKDRSDAEVVNDINQDLVSLFRVVRWHREAFIDELAYICHSRQEFNDYHDQPGLTDVQRAARFWYRLKTTFAGTGAKGHRNFSTNTLKFSTLRKTALDDVDFVSDRLDGVQIENLDFADLIARYDRPHTFYFADPPYWQSADYGVPFTWEDHQRLENSLGAIKGKFLVTINNHPDIRKLYRAYKQVKNQTRYSVCRDKSKPVQVTELIITNY